MRLIDADALLKDINDYPYGYRGMIKDTIAKQPTVEPKHGHWIVNDNPHTCRCSWCGNIELVDWALEQAKYCPNCGAKMDEVEDGV